MMRTYLFVCLSMVGCETETSELDLTSVPLCESTVLGLDELDSSALYDQYSAWRSGLVDGGWTIELEGTGPLLRERLAELEPSFVEDIAGGLFQGSAADFSGECNEFVVGIDALAMLDIAPGMSHGCCSVWSYPLEDQTQWRALCEIAPRYSDQALVDATEEALEHYGLHYTGSPVLILSFEGDGDEGQVEVHLSPNGSALPAMRLAHGSFTIGG